jgi:opacity protein-like surface antigen
MTRVTIIGTTVAIRSDETLVKEEHMTKSLIITLFILGSAVSHAQIDGYEIETIEKDIAKENDSDIDSKYKASNKSVDSDSSPQINIYNANSNANKQNQKAKVESAQDSEQEQDTNLDSYAAADAGAEYVVRANEIRKNRKNMEVGTEQKMIEKIEWSRIEDEKERADRLFGNRLEEKKKHHEERDEDENELRQEKTVVIVEKPVYQAPVAPVHKQEVVVEREETNNWWGRETYISPMFGTASYGKADNVRGDMALGVTLGSRLDSNISVEGTFLYSDYQMDDYAHYSFNGTPGLKDVAQYNGTLGLKYNFDLGRVSPHIGALLGYTYRSYEEKRNGSGSGDSNAFDAGLSAGVDVKVARNFSIGAEYRYMRNVAYDRTEDKAANQNLVNQQAFNPATAGKNIQPLEEIGYSMFLVNGKLTF